MGLNPRQTRGSAHLTKEHLLNQDGCAFWLHNTSARPGSHNYYWPQSYICPSTNKTPGSSEPTMLDQKSWGITISASQVHRCYRITARSQYPCPSNRASSDGPILPVPSLVGASQLVIDNKPACSSTLCVIVLVMLPCAMLFPSFHSIICQTTPSI